MLAATYGRLDMTLLFLINGADRSIKTNDKNPKTVLDIARKYDNQEIINLLEQPMDEIFNKAVRAEVEKTTTQLVKENTALKEENERLKKLLSENNIQLN
jgi:ankyrin repeat protein